MSPLLLLPALVLGAAAAQDGRTARRFLESLDQNQDSYVSIQEWRGSGRSFLDYDRDRSGYLTLDELAAGAASQERRPREPDLAERAANVAAAIVAFGEDPPAVLERRCTACHDTARILSARKRAREWAQTVERMSLKDGADIPERDAERIVGFLDAQRLVQAQQVLELGTDDARQRWAQVFDGAEFHRFDRDGNGRLAGVELTNLVMERLDFDGDGYLHAGEYRLMPARMEDFQRLDRNRDERLSAKELGQPPSLLETLDADEDRALSPEELPRARQGPSLLFLAADAEAVLALLDRNRDGVLSSKELRRREELLTAADRDRDRQLSTEEIQGAIDRARAQGMSRAFDDFVTRYDIDGDGAVERREFSGPEHVFRRCDRNGDGEVDEKDAPRGWQAPDLDDDSRRRR